MDARTDRNDSGTFAGSLACPALHISPLVSAFALVQVPEFARAVELLPLDRGPARTATPPKRMEITSFSRSSRRRLLWLIGSLHETILSKALFVTLTYPKGEALKADPHTHIDSLLKRLRRAAPTAAAIWKMEYTKADTPHFHVLILNLNFWHHKQIAKAWAHIVGSENPHHEEAGTRVERVLSQTHVAKYIVKYVAKSQPLPSTHKGRVWGKCGRIDLALSVKSVFALSREQFLAVRRTLDRLRKSYHPSRKFKRASNILQAQRWYLTGRCVIQYLQALGLAPITTSPT